MSAFVRLLPWAPVALLLLASCDRQKGADANAPRENIGEALDNVRPNRDEGRPTEDDVAWVEAISAGIVPPEVPRIGGYPVEDNVPKSVYPAIRRTAEAGLYDLRRHQDQLMKMHICLGRWDDPIGNHERISTWHICGESSIWTNPDYEFKF